MTKRKRTPPPPPPKPYVFTVPQSLTSFARIARQLREQTDGLAGQVLSPGHHAAAPAADQAIDLAVDAQLNNQLVATLEPTAQAGSSNPNSPNARRKQTKSSGKAAASLTQADEELRQSIIRDAEQQLGLGPSSYTIAPITHAHTVVDPNGQLGQPGYYDQSSTVAQIRFDPYVAPGQSTPHFYATSQHAPSPFPETQTSQYQYSNQIVPSSNTSSYNSPYVNIAPHPSGLASSRLSEIQQFSFPANQSQPGYYRLPPSYWQTPPPLQTNAMSEANQRAAAQVGTSVGSSNGLMDQRHGMRTLYPDPNGIMDMGSNDGVGVMNGGVFRNLTKERFGRYSVGGKLVDQREVYG